MTRAFVLHTRPFRDRSVLCDWFSEEGRWVSIVNKPSPKKGALEPFQPFWLDATPGRGEFMRIKRMERQGAAWHLPGLALFCGLYVNELLLLITQNNDAQPDLMVAYEQTLAALANHQSVEATLRQFELMLIQESGYALPFAEVDFGGYYRFDEQKGFSPIDPSFDGAYKGSTLHAIGQGLWDDQQVLCCAKHLLRQAIDALVQHRVIKTRRMMQELSEYV